MYNILQSTIIFIFSILPFVAAASAALNYNENWNGEIISNIIPHRRVKRGEHDLLDFGSGSTFPPDAELEDDNKLPETVSFFKY